MAFERAVTSEPIDLRRACSVSDQRRSRILYRSNRLEVGLLHLPTGSGVSERCFSGDVVVQCLEGYVAVELVGRRALLHAGMVLCVTGEQLHSLQALQASALLMTIDLSSAAEHDGLR